VTPGTFPYVKADGSGASITALSEFVRALLSIANAPTLLAAIGAAALNSPALSGTPTAPTAALNTNTAQLATMQALQQMRADMIGSAPATLSTFNEIAAAIGSDPNFSTTILTALGNRLRFDAAQTLTPGQMAQAVANLGLSLGTAAALNVGTAANNIPQLDASGKMPAVDGSRLTGIAAPTFPSGTVMLFVQATPPIGWTQETTHNDKALRVVSGTPGTGGVNPFSTVFGRTQVDATTLANSQMPVHNHGGATGTPNIGLWDHNVASVIAGGGPYGVMDTGGPHVHAIGYDGGGGSHIHTIDLRVLYVDVMLASKN
jgi:hypothetical protein